MAIAIAPTPRFTRDECLAALRNTQERFGRGLMTDAVYDELRQASEPSLEDIRFLFGTGRSARNAAGLPVSAAPSPYEGIGVAELVELVRDRVAPWAQEHGVWDGPPTHLTGQAIEAFCRAHQADDDVPSKDYIKRLIPYSELLPRAGFAPTRTAPFTVDKLRREMPVVAQLNGGHSPGAMRYRQLLHEHPEATLGFTRQCKVSQHYRHPDLTPSQAAEVLGVHVNAVHAQLRSGELRGKTRVGTDGEPRLLVSHQRVLAWARRVGRPLVEAERSTGWNAALLDCGLEPLDHPTLRRPRRKS